MTTLEIVNDTLQTAVIEATSTTEPTNIVIVPSLLAVVPPQTDFILIVTL